MSSGATVAGLRPGLSWQAGRWLPAFVLVLLVHGAVMIWLFGVATPVNLQASYGSPVYVDMVMPATPDAPAPSPSARPVPPEPAKPPEPVQEPTAPVPEPPAELAESVPEPDKAEPPTAEQPAPPDVSAKQSESSAPAAAPAPGVVSGREKAEQVNWQTRLLIHLERQKRYPLVARQRNEQGVVRVRVTIDRKGRVLSTSLAQSSGSQWLDREALALPARAQPLPAPPDSLPGDPLALQIPVSFTLR